MIYIATEPVKEFFNFLKERCPSISMVQCAANNIPVADKSVRVGSL